MKAARFLPVLVAGFFLVSCGGPEKDVLNRYEAMESIMEKHLDRPAEGVDKLVAYIEKNGPEMARLQTDVFLSVAKITKDGDREKRVEEINKQWETFGKNFEGSSGKFMKAVMADEKAKAKMDDFRKRMRDASGLKMPGNFMGVF
jgi:SMC interacting uncharacterized protein involved in chromosome segregation